MTDRKPQTMGRGPSPCPWSSASPVRIFQRLACFLLLCCLVLAGSSCQPASRRITLALLGDINLGRGVNPSSNSMAYLAAHLQAADLALGNLESPLGEKADVGMSGYNLCAPVEAARNLSDWGLDLLSLANNHANDCHLGGLEATRAALAEAGLTGLSDEPFLLEINGVTLVLLAFEDVTTLLDVEAASETIRRARAEDALVIVSVHWGLEYQGAPDPRQESIARQFAQAGAAVIWGHHPHVLQRADWIDTTLVLYSLGNALFDQGGLDETRQSALVLVTLDVDGAASLEAIPFQIDAPHSRIAAPDAEAEQEILSRLNLP